MDCPGHGFLRVHCDACGFDRLVPFACKRRGFCPSCGGRRMADTAAHLVDYVFPEVPVRQWVLTVPVALRYRMAFDAGLTADVHRRKRRLPTEQLRGRSSAGDCRGLSSSRASSSSTRCAARAAVIA